MKKLFCNVLVLSIMLGSFLSFSHKTACAQENKFSPADDMPNFSARDEGYKFDANPIQVVADGRKAAIVVGFLSMVLLLFVITGLKDRKNSSHR